MLTFWSYQYAFSSSWPGTTLTSFEDSLSHIIRRNISATVNFFPHNRAFMIMILTCLFSEKGKLLVTAWWLDIYGRQFPRVYLEQSTVGCKWADKRISSIERSSKLCNITGKSSFAVCSSFPVWVYSGTGQILRSLLRVGLFLQNCTSLGSLV